MQRARLICILAVGLLMPLAAHAQFVHTATHYVEGVTSTGSVPWEIEWQSDLTGTVTTGPGVWVAKVSGGIQTLCDTVTATVGGGPVYWVSYVPSDCTWGGWDDSILLTGVGSLPGLVVPPVLTLAAWNVSTAVRITGVDVSPIVWVQTNSDYDSYPDRLDNWVVVSNQTQSLGCHGDFNDDGLVGGPDFGALTSPEVWNKPANATSCADLYDAWPLWGCAP